MPDDLGALLDGLEKDIAEFSRQLEMGAGAAVEQDLGTMLLTNENLIRYFIEFTRLMIIENFKGAASAITNSDEWIARKAAGNKARILADGTSRNMNPANANKFGQATGHLYHDIIQKGMSKRSVHIDFIHAMSAQASSPGMKMFLTVAADSSIEFKYEIADNYFWRDYPIWTERMAQKENYSLMELEPYAEEFVTDQVIKAMEVILGTAAAMDTGLM